MTDADRIRKAITVMGHKLNGYEFGFDEYSNRSALRLDYDGDRHILVREDGAHHRSAAVRQKLFDAALDVLKEVK